MNVFQFPFGQPLKKVEQSDRSPKKAFVLGVYASAVHARWVQNNGKTIVNALAVASEPEIFWHGNNSQKIISQINIPKEAGSLVLPAKNLNGPSGKILDELYLQPLSFSRKDVWLCDILPESRLNPNQWKAITENYFPIMEKYNLPKVTVPRFTKKELDSDKRRAEILAELEKSQAKTLILLGDEPIRWFLHFFDKKYKRLSDFGESKETYGKGLDLKLNGKIYKVIPLCHPRQAGRLGSSSKKWSELHKDWISNLNS